MSDSIISEQSLYNYVDFSNHFVVKIAGKGNIQSNDNRNKNLAFNLNDAVDKILYYIDTTNINRYPVIICWDGDNYQGQEHDKPSPFTDIIYRLSKISGFILVALKFKKDNNPWKQKHVNTWNGMYFHKLFDNFEPHTIFNKICNMYISYGSTQFQFKDDDPIKGETSGYSQLQEFKQMYNVNTLYENNRIGFEIYFKN